MDSITARAEHKGREKCYGIAKAGENACANGIHTCAGKATRDRSGQDWALVEIGTCIRMGGRTEPFSEPDVPPAPSDRKQS
jgi:uncharacterized membrane protein